MQQTEEIEHDMQVTELEINVGDQINAGHGSINGGEWTEERSEVIKNGIEQNLVTVSPEAPGCCIDGRACTGCMNGEQTEPRHKVAGGPLVTAFAAAEATSWFDDDTSSSKERLERVNRLLKANNINTGAHCDEAAVAVQFEDPSTKQPKTGCGANDKLPRIVALFDTESATVHTLTAALLGDEFQENSMAFETAETLSKRTDEWCPTDVIDVIGMQDSGKSIEVLKADDTPTQGHREAAVVVIYKEDVTLDRDAFTEQTGEQVFVINMPYIKKMANALAGGPHATQQSSELQHAMVAYQVATYLELCDGSQHLITVS